MKRNTATIMMMTITLCLCLSGTVTAQDATLKDRLTPKMNPRQVAVEQEGPSLTIPTAAQHAENLAKASASTARIEILQFQQRVAKAEVILNSAKNSGSETSINAAQACYQTALQLLDASVANLTGVTINLCKKALKQYHTSKA